MKNPRYVAITATNSDWHLVTVGSDKDELRQRAEALIQRQEGGQRHTNIYLDTKLKNLRILSYTDSRRRFGIDPDRIESLMSFGPDD